MTKSKSARPKAKTLAANKPVVVAPIVDPGIAQLIVNVYDGTRRKIGPKTKVLITITDGAQNQLHRDYHQGSTTNFILPVHNNCADKYSVLAWADGYDQAGFQPVNVGPPLLSVLGSDASSEGSRLQFRPSRVGRHSGKKAPSGEHFRCERAARREHDLFPVDRRAAGPSCMFTQHHDGYAAGISAKWNAP